LEFCNRPVNATNKVIKAKKTTDALVECGRVENSRYTEISKE